MNDNIIQFVRAKEKNGDDMCKILKKIHGKTAEELLIEYNVYDSIPIDLEKLATEIGISVIPKDFTLLEKKLNKNDILGLVLTAGDNAAIFYRESDSLNRRRFTIAHELAHCCNLDPTTKEPHVEYRIDESEKDDFEKEMDIFAGKLLIPFKKLKEIYLSLDIPSSVTLARIFQVSINVMEARLNHLGISYYNSKGQAIIHES